MGYWFDCYKCNFARFFYHLHYCRRKFNFFLFIIQKVYYNFFCNLSVIAENLIKNQIKFMTWIMGNKG